MFQLIDFSSWTEYIDAPEGSGASEKVWLVNKNDNHKGLFKYPKIMTNGEITGEYWAEKLASHIGKLLNIECAKVDIGVLDGRKGSMSYNILKEDEILNEGIVYITYKYSFYNGDRLEDTFSDMKYSIQMILNSIKDYDFYKDFFRVPIFDCLIGNSDRHHSNWENYY